MAATEANWTVCDLNATTNSGPRIHRARDTGTRELLGTFEFHPAARVEMPMRHAMSFLGKDGFEVRDENGQKMRLSGGIEAQKETRPLASDEVVAKLDELTNDSLAARCRELPGGADYHKRSKKDAMIAFIIQGGDSEAPMLAEVADGDGEDVEGIERLEADEA